MSGLRALALGIGLAIAVAVGQRALTGLVSVSGARDTPALILILLLAAFLGVLTAVATRMLRLPGATAPTALVLGYTILAGILARLAAGVPQIAIEPVALSGADALGLAAATVAAAVTLGVPAERR